MHYSFKALVFLGLLTSASAAMGSTVYNWKIEDVDAVGTGSRSAEVEVSPDGRIHLAYAGCGKKNCNPETALWYAVRTPNGAWQRTMIDNSSEDVGRHANVEVEPSGTVHILYGDKTKELLKWATLKNNEKAWKFGKVSPKFGGSWVSSTRYDSTIYVTHTRFNRTQMRDNFLELGTYRNGKWTFEVLEGGGWVTSVTTAQNGDLVIGSHDGPYFRGDTHLNYQENGIWKRQAIDGVSTKLNVAVDSKGFIHAVYAKADPTSTEPADDVYYATNAPDGKWKRDILAGNNSSRADAFFPSIAIDKHDAIHVSYRDYELNLLRYARKADGGKWVHSIIEDMGRPLYSKVIVGPDGKLHVAFESSNRMYYGVCEDCTDVK